MLILVVIFNFMKAKNILHVLPCITDDNLQMVPDLGWFVQLTIVLTLQWCKSNMHSVEATLQILNFYPFPGQQYAVQYSPVILGSSNKPQLPVTHTIMRVNSQDTQNHSVPRQPFFFTLSVFNKLHEKFNTLL